MSDIMKAITRVQSRSIGGNFTLKRQCSRRNVLCMKSKVFFYLRIPLGVGWCKFCYNTYLYNWSLIFYPSSGLLQTILNSSTKKKYGHLLQFQVVRVFDLPLNHFSMKNFRYQSMGELFCWNKEKRNCFIIRSITSKKTSDDITDHLMTCACVVFLKTITLWKLERIYNSCSKFISNWERNNSVKLAWQIWQRAICILTGDLQMR